MKEAEVPDINVRHRRNERHLDLVQVLSQTG